MVVYRIARERYVRDLSGEGARLAGGRWNRKGVAVLYTAVNRSLATVEYLVHLPLGMVFPDTCIAEITIPDDLLFDAILEADLPFDWHSYPAPLALAERGEQWLKGEKTAVLKVPSSIVRGEQNVLINPSMISISGITLSAVEPYALNARLVR